MVQKYRPERLIHNKTKISEFIVDETQLNVGSELIWLWVDIESETNNILGRNISKEQNMFVVKRFISKVVDKHGLCPVSTLDGGTWHPQTCKVPKIEHYIHSSYEKSR